ncbi:hypothetical protein BJ912DRAFT_841196 [Pholiota molesta]|nr:hypothetical protein BJ912DRAFT_841196 [Pholiota molesta]
MVGDGDSESDVTFDDLNGTLPRKRGRTVDPAVAREWYPWHDRLTCTLDILMHLPRSVFSRKQLDLFLWLLRVNRVSDVPTGKTMKGLNTTLQQMCGIDTIEYDGKLGHKYHVNSLAQILAQEMSNPKVRPHLHFYPEDTSPSLSEAYQASRWLNELTPEETTPMVRINKNDYFIYEPTMTTDMKVCIPIRWFHRCGIIYARAWMLESTIVDGQIGWVVNQDEEVEIAQHQLFKNLPQLAADHERYHIPHPSLIHGIRSNHHIDLQRWTLTNPILGNRWRSLAKGHRVLSLPLWVYCDDTSGNTSKKWNEHNSFLFTLAGLPREQVAKEYNIHFLCTSNLAPPLEMMDGVVSQIELGQRDGIWAWDCVYKELVLIFPTTLALLGDNPMHSEFACHIGLRGKYFCRACWVKGTDTQDGQNMPNIAEQISEQTALASPRGNTTRKKGKFQETMAAMITRISAFIKPGVLRSKKETMRQLNTYYEHAKTVGTKTMLKQLRTDSGIKDTVQEHFLEKLFSAYKSKRGAKAKEDALAAAVNALPDDITSPVWRLQGLDPHVDTPVEILHVVLLGFVKYFWRDLIANQINDDQKRVLVVRLDSLNVDGLGISKLGGNTLVRYANSLTGRDFRAIAQVAPFVIYDMVPSDVYDAWVSLSTLIPLIWQPLIKDISRYLETLTKEIKNFLLKTARWNCAWFNKSKFHIITHLPEHIRRFGPAILFATEAFESFNAVIRSKSVHSNRQAPSRDIALAFAQGNRIRHLLSGGYFLPTRTGSHPNLHGRLESDWCTAGPGPMRLALDPTPSHYLGIAPPEVIQPGQCKPEKIAPQPLTHTLTGQKIATALNTGSPSALYVTNVSVVLLNGDRCTLGQHVIVQQHPLDPASSEFRGYIGRVQEIIQQFGSINHQNGWPDGLLVQVLDCYHPPFNESAIDNMSRISMPQLILRDEWNLVPLVDVLCTVNTQHQCERNGCTTSGTRYICQERVQTSHTASVVQHLNNPNDQLLNMAQMRDAINLQNFRIPTTPLDEEAEVLKSVTRVINERKAAASGTNLARGRGRGGSVRGRGRGVAPSSSGLRVGSGPLEGIAEGIAEVRGSTEQVTGQARGRGRGRPRGRGTIIPGESSFHLSDLDNTQL